MPQFDFPIVASNLSFEDIRRVAQEAETLGYHMISVGDHLPTTDRPLFEQWTTLAYIAAATQTIKVGTLVTNSNFRAPALLAKLGATLDHLSHGRLVLGIAAGGNGRGEYEASGLPYLEPRARIDKLAEAIQIVKLLWTQERVSFAGKYFTFHDAYSEPKPVQKPHPPIWVGQDKSQYTLRIAGKYADGINMHANSPEHARQKAEVVREASWEAGRVPDDVEVIVKHFVILEPTAEELESRFAQEAAEKKMSPREYVADLKAQNPDAMIGTPEECVARYKEYIAAGFTHFTPIVLPNYGQQVFRNMHLFAERVMQALA